MMYVCTQTANPSQHYKFRELGENETMSHVRTNPCGQNKRSRRPLGDKNASFNMAWSAVRAPEHSDAHVGHACVRKPTASRVALRSTEIVATLNQIRTRATCETLRCETFINESKSWENRECVIF